MLMDREKIKEILPHRDPFLFLDGILELTEDKVVAVANITKDMDVFRGHFPGMPIFPGVLQIEASAQAAGVLGFSKLEDDEDRTTLFAGVESVKWKKPIIPDAELRIEACIDKRRGPLIKASAKVFVGEEIASEVNGMTLMLVPKKEV